MKFSAQKGTKDILPSEIYRWQTAEKTFASVCHSFGYEEIRIPTFEQTDLFARGVGDTTDVVTKEMYTFEDKGKRSITLKPEGTAGAVRSFLEHNLYAEPLPCKLYYMYSPHFRYENPQSGRLREHHQFGMECFGAKEATVDAELILTAYHLLQDLGVSNLSVEINSIGCPNCRPEYHKRLKEFLGERIHEMCPTCQERFERNPLRVLDCKEKKCQELTKEAPSMLDLLCDECKDHFEQLKKCLDSSGIPYRVNSRIVRGLDYYTKTVFEIVTETTDGKLTVCGGGRYDNLVQEIGDQSIPAAGFGMGEERVLMLLEAEGVDIPKPEWYEVFVTYMGENKQNAFALVQQLRAAGIKADMDHCGRSLKAQFKYANKTGAPVTAVIGDDEAANGTVKLKKMADGTEVTVKVEEAAKAVRDLKG